MALWEDQESTFQAEQAKKKEEQNRPECDRAGDQVCQQADSRLSRADPTRLCDSCHPSLQNQNDFSKCLRKRVRTNAVSEVVVFGELLDDAVDLQRQLARWADDNHTSAWRYTRTFN